MKQQGADRFVYRRLALALALMAPASVLAATQAGFVLVATGNVKAVGKDGAVRELTRRSPVFAGDRLVTAAGARAQVKFTDGAIVGLKPKTELRIDDYRYEPDGGAQASFMSLIKGGLRTVSGAIGKTNKADYKVSTPVATIGIRGTFWEGDYTPDGPLDLAVWDGGISACNADGCLDLGDGADHRYGRIYPDGRREGRNDDGDDEEEEDDGALGNLEHDMLDEDIQLFIPDDYNPRRAYAGFAVVADVQGDNPWGSDRLLTVEEAYAEINSYGGYVDSFAMRPAALGGDYINSFFAYGGEQSSWSGSGDAYAMGRDGETTVIVGEWYGNSVSVGPDAFVGTETLVPNSGLFVFGDAATPAAVSTLTGSTYFSLEALRFMQAGAVTYSYNSSGYMQVDMGTGSVTGDLVFDDSYTGDVWKLLFDGTASSSGLDLSLVTNAADAGSGSHLYVQTAGLPSAVDGTIQAMFVGHDGVDGILGAFDVATLDDAFSAQGVFAMESDLKFAGYAVASEFNGANPWGAEGGVVQVEEVSAGIQNFGYSSFVDHWSLKSSALGDQYINSVYSSTGTSDWTGDADILYVGREADSIAVLGTWLGNDVSWGPEQNLATTTLVPNAGTFVFGDVASPSVVASLTGEADFVLRSLVFVEDGSIQTLYGRDGGLKLDLATGDASGHLMFANVGGDTWHLLVDGTVDTTGLSLAVLTDLATTYAGSYRYDVADVTDTPVTGTIAANFVGIDSVDGIIGAFDVATTDAAHTAQGAFVMEPEAVYAGFAVTNEEAFGENPWGPELLLTVEDARVSVDNLDGYGDVVTDWTMLSSTADGQYLTAGYDCGESCSWNGSATVSSFGARNETKVVWGWWAGNDASVGSEAGVVSTTEIQNGGLFVLGELAPPAVVARMTGSTGFTLDYNGVQMMDGATPVTAVGGYGGMDVDLDAGDAAGSLAFANAAGDQWNLAFSGSVSTSGMSLDITAGQDAVQDASYFAPTGWTAVAELQGVDGAIQAAFVGSTQVDGVIGAFDVHTLDQSQATQGTFVMYKLNVINTEN